MYKARKHFGLLCLIMCILICCTGCGGKEAASTDGADRESSLSNIENEDKNEDESENENKNQNDSVTETVGEANNTEQEETAADGLKSKNDRPSQIIATDLEPSEGFEYESNGDGTCTIVGIGTCKDTDIVIPTKSPEGDTVTLIDEYALDSLEDVESITLANYNYEIGKGAFQYSEFTTLAIIGGTPIIKENAFSSCEDLNAISIIDCDIQADDYAFYSCGKDADVIIEGCTGTIGKCAFEYGDIVSITISDCELEIEESVFSFCEGLTSIIFSDSTLETGEYAFYSCGDSAIVEMTDCSLIFDDYAFQYGSYISLTITGSEVIMGESVFSSCEDLEEITIDCDSVTMGEYAFYNCEDLASVTICPNAKSDNEIKIDDWAFQYCEVLKTVDIGNGNIEIGEGVFSGCDENLAINIAGKSYAADDIEDGLK